MSVPGGARKVCESSENGVYASPVVMRHPLPLPHHFHNHCHRYPHSHCQRRHYLLANPVENSPSPPLSSPTNVIVVIIIIIIIITIIIIFLVIIFLPTL